MKTTTPPRPQVTSPQPSPTTARPRAVRVATPVAAPVAKPVRSQARAGTNAWIWAAGAFFVAFASSTLTAESQAARQRAEANRMRHELDAIRAESDLLTDQIQMRTNTAAWETYAIGNGMRYVGAPEEPTEAEAAANASNANVRQPQGGARRG